MKDQDPCDTQYHEKRMTNSFADMVLPALSKTKYESMNLKAGGTFMSRDDFDAIRADCLSLFQTKETLRNANFLNHLMNYDPPEGLRLATAQMMIQGFNNGGDILRMANNIIKLKQAQIKLDNNVSYQGKKRMLQIYTMSMDDFISQPTISALNFFNFVLDTLPPVPQSRKEDAAYRYWQHYAEKMNNSDPNIRSHVTHNRKSIDKEYLMEYLRHDSVFGPSLSRIELLVEASLITQ